MENGKSSLSSLPALILPVLNAVRTLIYCLSLAPSLQPRAEVLLRDDRTHAVAARSVLTGLKPSHRPGGIRPSALEIPATRPPAFLAPVRRLSPPILASESFQLYARSRLLRSSSLPPQPPRSRTH